jgi:hypothetical protein
MQEDHEFEIIMGYIGRPYLQQPKTTKQKSQHDCACRLLSPSTCLHSGLVFRETFVTEALGAHFHGLKDFLLFPSRERKRGRVRPDYGSHPIPQRGNRATVSSLQCTSLCHPKEASEFHVFPRKGVATRLRASPLSVPPYPYWDRH